MEINSDIVSYYKNRAKEYERIYSKPERQSSLLLAEKILQDLFRGKDVFEIACGTGYWTKKIAATANTIAAADINDIVIEIAKSKNYSPAKVDFETADIFSLENHIKYESLFGGFIWSHIKLHDLNNFISITNRLVKPGGMLVFMDNNYVSGSNLPVTGQDNSGNTYQTRTLDNGTIHTVLKNFPTEKYIREFLTDKATDISFINLHYYWILKYKNIGAT
jgi:SAM-dependent methyltransferase